MCGRYSLAKDRKYLERRYGVKIEQTDMFEERFNIPPSSDVPTIVFSNGRRILQPMKWGVYRQWSKDRPPVFITNLRAEKLAKGAFKGLLSRRRCLVPADGFYEWKTVDGKKLPFRFTMENDEAFSFAGIFDEPSEELGPPIPTFTIFTTEPNPLVAKVHDRMPCILPMELEETWLDPKMADANEVIGMLAPYPADKMKSYGVSPALNSPKNDSPKVIEPI